MTRRLVLIPDYSVTETECGECRFFGLVVCDAFDLAHDNGPRLPECLEAERVASRLVEIDPADAARVNVVAHTRRHGHEAYGSADRVREAIREHGSKR